MSGGPLGCGHTSVFVIDRPGYPQLTELDGINSLIYSRILDDTSEARIRLQLKGDRAGTCCDVLGDLRTWRHGVRLVREGEIAWEGVITELDHGADEVEIIANDVTAWLDVRVIHNLIDHTAATGDGPKDLARIAEEIIRDGLAPDDPGVLDYLIVEDAGVVAEKKYEANKSYVGTELRQLARTAIDFTAIGRSIWIHGESSITRSVAALTDDDFLVGIKIIESGKDAATKAYVNGSGVKASFGGVDPFYGLIEVLHKEDNIIDQASADQAVRLDVALGNPAPLIVQVPDGASLSYNAPIDFKDLVPGMLLDIYSSATCRDVQTTQRLLKVRVQETSDSGEKVQVTLGPYGTVSSV